MTTKTELTKEWDDRINFILENFDFDRVYKVMTCLDWKWKIKKGQDSFYAVPSVFALIKTSKQLLEACIIDGSSYVATGGFVATLDSDLKLGLYFRVEYFSEDDYGGE